MLLEINRWLRTAYLWRHEPFIANIGLPYELMFVHSNTTRLHHHLVEISILSLVRLEWVFRLLRDWFLRVFGKRWRVQLIWIVLFVLLRALFLWNWVVTAGCIRVFIFLMDFLKNRVSFGRWEVHHALSHLFLLSSFLCYLHVHLHEVCVLLNHAAREDLLHAATTWLFARRLIFRGSLILLHRRYHARIILNLSQILAVELVTTRYRERLHSVLWLMDCDFVRLVHLVLELFEFDLNLFEGFFVVIYNFFHLWLLFYQRLKL